MLPGMRFYIVSIVSIFTALGIGIYIGFAINSHEFIVEQQENLTNILELQFEKLIDENIQVKDENQELKLQNNYMNEYIYSSFDFLIQNRLNGLNVGIIETNSDYIISGIGKDLEMAGANVINLTTLNQSILEKDNLQENISQILIDIIKGQGNDNFADLKNEEYIDYIGNYNEPIDYLIMAGGAFEDPLDRINKIDRPIVELARSYNIPIIGIEKSNVNYSYIKAYKELDITTVDNVDMTIGKVAMILSMEGITGNYGIKETANSVLPISMKEILEQ